MKLYGGLSLTTPTRICLDWMMRSSVPAPELACGWPPPGAAGANGLQAPSTTTAHSDRTAPTSRGQERAEWNTTSPPGPRIAARGVARIASAAQWPAAPALDP